MDNKDKLIEELQFENKKLKCENEYIKKNLEAFKQRQLVTEAEANSRVINIMLKIRRKLKRG